MKGDATVGDGTAFMHLHRTSRAGWVNHSHLHSDAPHRHTFDDEGHVLDDGVTDAYGRPLSNAVLLEQLTAERDRADRMAAMLRSEDIYDPSEVLAEHDAARAGGAARG